MCKPWRLSTDSPTQSRGTGCRKTLGGGAGPVGGAGSLVPPARRPARTALERGLTLRGRSSFPPRYRRTPDGPRTPLNGPPTASTGPTRGSHRPHTAHPPGAPDDPRWRDGPRRPTARPRSGTRAPALRRARQPPPASTVGDTHRPPAPHTHPTPPSAGQAAARPGRTDRPHAHPRHPTPRHSRRTTLGQPPRRARNRTPPRPAHRARRPRRRAGASAGRRARVRPPGGPRAGAARPAGPAHRAGAESAIWRDMIVVSSYAVWDAATEVISAWS